MHLAHSEVLHACMHACMQGSTLQPGKLADCSQEPHADLLERAGHLTLGDVLCQQIRGKKRKEEESRDAHCWMPSQTGAMAGKASAVCSKPYCALSASSLMMSCAQQATPPVTAQMRRAGLVCLFPSSHVCCFEQACQLAAACMQRARGAFNDVDAGWDPPLACS